jgi:hypothetical protein
LADSLEGNGRDFYPSIFDTWFALYNVKVLIHRGSTVLLTPPRSIPSISWCPAFFSSRIIEPCRRVVPFYSPFALHAGGFRCSRFWRSLSDELIITPIAMAVPTSIATAIPTIKSFFLRHCRKARLSSRLSGSRGGRPEEVYWFIVSFSTRVSESEAAESRLSGAIGRAMML